MAVLVEANSVIIRTQAIRERYTGGWNEFAEAVPNGTLDVARVGFMNPDDLRELHRQPRASRPHLPAQRPKPEHRRRYSPTA